MKQQVLVVDGIPETEEVLKAVFEARGYEVNRIRRRHAQQSQPSRQRPKVVVVDLDDDRQPGPLDVDQTWEEIPRVLIGPRRVTAVETVNASNACYLPKPFQYPDLVQAIERLLETHVGTDPA